MTLVSLPSPIYWPGLCGLPTGSVAVGNASTLSSAGHYQSYIFCAKEDMTVSHVEFRAGTATGSPTIEVRIETVDATGLPSGTLWATNTNGTTGTITSNTNVLQALTASASITKGQIFCVMMKYASGTSQVIGAISSFTTPVQSSLPYIVTNTGTPTKSAITTGTSPNLALGSSSTTFYHLPGAFPLSSVTGGGFNNTNSAKKGLRFTPPMNCRAIGVRWYNQNAAGDYNAIIFNDAGTELSSSSTAFDGDHNAASGSACLSAYFDNTVTLTAGTTYRVAIEPSSATNASVYALVLPSANYRGATAAGTTAHYTTFATATWTDTATDTIPLMDIIIDQVDDGTGSGGGGVIGVICG
jgi:hypothetical protein